MSRAETLISPDDANQEDWYAWCVSSIAATSVDWSEDLSDGEDDSIDGTVGAMDGMPDELSKETAPVVQEGV